MLRSAGLARLSVCCIGALKAQAKMSLAAVTKTPLFLATVGRPRQRDALSPTEAQSYATRIPSFLQDTQRFSVRLPRVAMLGGERTFTNAAGDGDPGADFDPDAARKMLVEEGGLLIDVRTAEEFAGGAVQGSVNISHDFLPSRFGEVRFFVRACSACVYL